MLRTETGYVRCWWKVAFTICIFWQLPVTCFTELCYSTGRTGNTPALEDSYFNFQLELCRIFFSGIWCQRPVRFSWGRTYALKQETASTCEQYKFSFCSRSGTKGSYIVVSRQVTWVLSVIVSRTGCVFGSCLPASFPLFIYAVPVSVLSVRALKRIITTLVRCSQKEPRRPVLSVMVDVVTNCWMCHINNGAATLWLFTLVFSNLCLVETVVKLVALSRL